MLERQSPIEFQPPVVYLAGSYEVIVDSDLPLEEGFPNTVFSQEESKKPETKPKRMRKSTRKETDNVNPNPTRHPYAPWKLANGGYAFKDPKTGLIYTMAK